MIDRSHTQLVKLDALKPTLTYSGWQKDFRDAEDAHGERAYSADFPKALRKLKVKQKMHDGDRSHPRLVALDDIKKKLTYPGWEADVMQVEKAHIEEPYIARSDIGFNNKLKALEYSQMMYEANGEETSTPTETSQNCHEIIDSDSQSSQQREKRQNNKTFGDCTVCGDEYKSHAFVPCGHLAVCGECAAKVMRRSPRCPMCRCRALETLEIFL